MADDAVENPVAADAEAPDAEDATEEAFEAEAEAPVEEVVPSGTYIDPTMRERDAPPMSWQEHKEALRQSVTALYHDIDKDGDGALTKHEIAVRMKEDNSLEDLMHLAGQSSKNIIDTLDADKDGTVSLKEFLDILANQGAEYTIEWLEEQIVFQHNAQMDRRLNVLTVETGYDASTVKTDAEKCNAEWDAESGTYQRDLGKVFPVWALMFSMVEDSETGACTDNITHEAVEVIQRMWELDLSVNVRRTVDRGEIIVLVGIPYVTMQQEAEEMQMKLRMTDTRGTLEYQAEFHDRFADYVRHPMDKDGKVFIDEAKGAEEGNFRCKQYATVFNSTHQQQAVLNRITKNGIDLHFRMGLMPLDSLLKRIKKAVSHTRPVRAFQLKELLTAAGGFRENCDKIMGDNVDLLAEQVLADPFMTIYHPDQCKDDGTKKEQHAFDQMKIANTHMSEYRYALGAPGSQLEWNNKRFPDGLPPIAYEHVEKLISSLESFCFPEVPARTDKKTGEIVLAIPAGPGADEQYIESLQLFFPVHNQEELTFLRNRWGSWNQLWNNNFRSKEVEGETTPCWNIMDDAPDEGEFDANAPYNTPVVRFGCLYQPIDEIRDYFGDDNAIYFSWLATYTKALGIAGVFGFWTMLFQFWKPEFLLTEKNGQVVMPPAGVDGNPATLMYSIFMSIWSVLFLSVWRRKEAEHAFLWGSEGFEEGEEPRPAFKGVLVVNPETGREDLVEGNYMVKLVKKSFSTCVILMCMFSTVFGAFQAMALKNKAPKVCLTGADSVVTHEALQCGPGSGNHMWPTADFPTFDFECCYDDKDLCYNMNDCGGPISGSESGYQYGANGIVDAKCPFPAPTELPLVCAAPGTDCVPNMYLIPNGTTVEDFCGPRQSVAWHTMEFGPMMKYKLMSAGMNLVIIQSAGLIYEFIADYLNTMENFRTETDYSDGLIIKNFLFQFVNNYFVLFYIAYARQLPVGNTPGKECPSSCLGEIQTQMLVVFTAKTFGLQAVELAKPFIMKKLKMVTEMKHMRQMLDAVDEASSAAAKAVAESANAAGKLALSEEQRAEMGMDDDAMEEAKVREERRLKEQKRKNAKADQVQEQEAKGKPKAGLMMCEYELQTHMVNYEDKGTFDDFNEMAIQYGYIALFSPSFPVAPLLAFINNLTEIRGDAWKLCKGFQRPQASPAEDIGSWFTVLNLLGFVAVITNATMIAFVGSQLAADDFEKEGIMHRFETARLWIYAVMVEHGVMMTRVCILIFFPVYPDWIGDAKDVLRFRVGEMKKLSRARREQAIEDAGGSPRGTRSPRASPGAQDNSKEAIKARKQKDRKFRHADVDGNRRLTREEFIHEFGEEAAQKFDALDVNKDGVVDAAEWADGVEVSTRKNRARETLKGT